MMLFVTLGKRRSKQRHSRRKSDLVTMQVIQPQNDSLYNVVFLME
jgi:hypothetical protein